MLNQSAEYALRAVLYMARLGAEKPFKATDIAADLGLPPTYLSKIMHGLVRARVLRSLRGPAGGYSLAIVPEALSIERVVAPFQDLEPEGRCLMGDRACDIEHPCDAHQRWSQMKSEVTSFLQHTTVADMLTPLPARADTPITLTGVA